MALDFALPWQTYAWSILGIALIGFTNLTVSFVLALWVALKSRGVNFGQTRQLVVLLSRRFRARPGSFFLPPKETPAS